MINRPGIPIGQFEVKCPKCNRVVSDIEIIVCGDDLCAEVMEAEIKKTLLKRTCEYIEEGD